MRTEKTERGFTTVRHPKYAGIVDPAVEMEPRIVMESSAIGGDNDALDKPGSSFLWVGEYHHLNRDEVHNLAHKLLRWHDCGRLD